MEHMVSTKVKSEMTSPTLCLDPPLITALRDDLVRADWTVATTDALLSSEASLALASDQLVPASVELATNGSPAALLTRLFVLAEVLTSSECAVAFPTLSPAGATDLGLIQEREQGGFSARVDLRPHAATLPDAEGRPSRDKNWWVASDLSQAQTGLPPRQDYVLGIASASTTLLNLTIRKPVESALDLGCGSGVLALYLAEHVRKVTATDISERACMFTRFNAALNQVDIDVRQGSLFESVSNDRFDLITSNPPFVITPDSVRAKVSLEYRDGMMERDSLIPLILEEGLTHLTPGGVLQMLANWEVGDDVWQARPEMWVERAAAPIVDRGQGVRAWIVQRDLVGTPTYSAWWMRDAHGDGMVREAWNAELREWLSDFAAARTKQVGLGSINVTLTSKPEVVVVSEFLQDGSAPDGQAASTALSNLQIPDDWEDLAFRRSPDVREVRYYQPGESDPEMIMLAQGRAGGRERQVGSALAAFVGVADGELTAKQVIPAIAVLLGKEPEEIRAEIQASLPELLRSGVLRVARP